METVPALKAAYPKLESYAVRLALLLHILWAVAANEIPSASISDETLGRALHLVNFYMGQLRLVISHSGGDQRIQLEGSLLKIKALLDRKGSITARDIKTSIWNLRQTPIDEIRSLMTALEKLGVGRIQGQGRKAILTRTVENVDELLMPHQQDQSQSQKGIQRFVEDVDDQACVQGGAPPAGQQSSDQIQGDPVRARETSTPSTITSLEAEALTPQGSKGVDPTSTNHQQTLNSINNWIPQVGEWVRYVPGKAPCDVWEDLDLEVVKVIDPQLGIVAVKGSQWRVSQRASPAILQPV